MTARPSVLLHTNSGDLGLRILAETHPDLAAEVCGTYAGLEEALARTKAEVVYSVRFEDGGRYPREALLNCPTLRWLSVGGSGTDHLRPWDPARLTITNVAGVAADVMAEYAIMSMIWFAHERFHYMRAQAAHQWSPVTIAPVAGRTLLIVGLGKTGVAVARRAKALGMTTLGVRANPRPTDHVDEVHPDAALPALAARADYIVVSVPLTEATRGLFDDRLFAAMKPGAVLVDLSRGGIVSGAALLRALDSGRLKGAALDVFETEPLSPDSRLWGRDNVLLTPHASAVFDGWEEAAIRIFADNLHRYRRGAPLFNIVDPVRGY